MGVQSSVSWIMVVLDLDIIETLSSREEEELFWCSENS